MLCRLLSFVPKHGNNVVDFWEDLYYEILHHHSIAFLPEKKKGKEALWGGLVTRGVRRHA